MAFRTFNAHYLAAGSNMKAALGAFVCFKLGHSELPLILLLLLVAFLFLHVALLNLQLALLLLHVALLLLQLALLLQVALLLRVDPKMSPFLRWSFLYAYAKCFGTNIKKRNHAIPFFLPFQALDACDPAELMQ